MIEQYEVLVYKPWFIIYGSIYKGCKEFANLLAEQKQKELGNEWIVEVVKIK